MKHTTFEQPTKLTLKAAQDAGMICSTNSKMPGSTYALPVAQCAIGSVLALVAGSVCFKCYAKKAERLYPPVSKSRASNLSKASMITTDPDLWARSMALQIQRKATKSGVPFHRWFDAGDIQSVAMLRAIVLTCLLTPSVGHWLSTREAAILKAYKASYGDFPSNLVVRMSSTMTNDKQISGHAHTSTVHSKGVTLVGHICLASQNKGACGACRACWSQVANISYPLH